MKQEVLKMSEQFMKYVGELITDVDYVASGYPNDFLEVKMEQELPFRFYCSMQDGDWEEISNAARVNWGTKGSEINVLEKRSSLLHA